MSDNLNMIIEQANSAMLARDFSFAEKILNKQLKKIDSKNSEDAFKIKELLGKLYIRSGSLEKGLETYKELNEIKANNVDILNNLGIIYRRLNRFEESVAILEKAEALDDTNVTTLYNLGNTYKQKEDYENAIQCFTKVLDTKTDDVLAYNHLGSVYLLCGKTKEAIESYKTGLRIDPNHPFLNFNLANIYKDQKKYNEAILRYKAALKTKPNWKDALTAIAESYIQNNELQKAISMYKEIIKKNAPNEYTLTKLAELYELNNDDIGAEAYFKKALYLKENFLPAILSYAKLLKKQNRHFDAYNLLSNAKDTKNKDLLLQLADTSLLLEDYAMTKECLKTLIENWNQDIEILKMRGKLHSMLGEKKQAEVIFKHILAKSPREIKLRLELADLYAHNDKYESAAEELKKYLNEKPQDISARLKLGKAYEGCKQYDKARAEYNKIIRNDAKNTEALKAIMELNRKEGNDAEAIKLANEIVDINIEDESAQNLDELSNSLELYEEAVSAYDSDELVNKNLEQFKSSEDGVDITPEGIEENLVVEKTEEDEMTLDDDLSLKDADDLEMPFDDLMDLADDDYFEERKNDDIQDLVSFDEPIDDTPNLGTDEQINSSAINLAPKKQNEYIPEEEITLGNMEPVMTVPQQAMPEQAMPEQAKPEDEMPSQAIPEQSMQQQASKPLQFEEGEEDFNLPATTPLPTEPINPNYETDTNGVIDTDSFEEELSETNDSSEQLANEVPRDEKPKALKASEEDTLESLNKAAENIGDITDALSKKVDQLKVPKEQPQNIEESITQNTKKDTEEVSPKEENNILPEEENTTAEEDVSPNLEADTIPEEENILQDSEADIAIEEPALSIEEEIISEENYFSRKEELLKSISRRLKPQAEFERELELIKKEDILDLFSYIRELMTSLPETELKDFLISNERIQMEYVINKLRGELGLKQKVALLNIKNTLEKTQTPQNKTEKTLKDTLGYLRVVAFQLPDKGFAASCSNRISGLMESLNS